MWRYLLASLSVVFFFSCKKEGLLTSSDAPLQFTVDSLYFDTVFTTAGSVTKSLRIKNDNNQRIRINRIHLAGGQASVFRINVNGEQGPEIGSLEIDGGDSAHVFVNLTIPADNETQPFLVRDSISVQWNGKEKWIQLSAYGQNARYIKEGIISGTITWDAELPYVLIGPLTVEEGGHLHLEKGTRIYAEADAPVLVYGRLTAEGDTAAADRVVFNGSRLDAPYSGYPASWPGIYFFESSAGNQLHYTSIQNAYQAVVVQGSGNGPTTQLELEQVIINNAWDGGIIAINASVDAKNLLITNCGQNLRIAGGGYYRFDHCTIAAISNDMMLHKDPMVTISNIVSINSQTIENPLDLRFRNCIIWGDGNAVENEVVAQREGSSPYKILFETGIWKMVQPSSLIESIDMLQENPLFEQFAPGVNHYNFRLREPSPAIDRGLDLGLPLDLDGNPRSDGRPDLGAYEKQ
ncbi:MAG TPA: choice-of-anchor Q domain-containing protein [Flavihumibacter sp.]